MVNWRALAFALAFYTLGFSSYVVSRTGLPARLTGDLGASYVVEEVDGFVILSEKAYERSLMDRPFGT